MRAARGLARWALGLTAADVPAPVRAAACRHLLDGLGCAVAAARSGAATPAVTVALGLGGPTEATVLGTGRRVGAPAAALASGALVHALDFDDTHAGGLVHATASVLPAALAVGEQTGASGEDVLVAAVAGYEAVCRIGAAAPHAFHARGLHATAACGVFAAALVTARLLGLDEDTTTDALGIAGSGAGGLLEFLATGASTKQLHPGMAAATGILAARLAAAGASGPDSVLEGTQGLYAALADRRVEAAAVLDGLGSRWETSRITIKPYPACQLLHVTLDAVRAAGVPGRDVVGVCAEVHPDSAAVVCGPGKDHPRTPYDAKFSLPWSVAALLLDGAVTVDTYTAPSIARPEVAALAARVETQDGPGSGLAADAPGHVVLTLADGRTVEGRVPGSAGGPDRPLDPEAFAAKLAGNLGVPPGDADALTAAVACLAAQPDLRAVVAAADRLGGTP